MTPGWNPPSPPPQKKKLRLWVRGNAPIFKNMIVTALRYYNLLCTLFVNLPQIHFHLCEVSFMIKATCLITAQSVHTN